MAEKHGIATAAAIIRQGYEGETESQFEGAPSTPSGKGAAAALGGVGAPVKMELIVPNPKLKLLEQVREVMRLRHYSI